MGSDDGGSREKDVLILFMYFCYFIIISRPWRMEGPSFEQTLIPIAQGCFVPTLVEIGQVVQEKKISELCQCIYAISYYVSLEKKRGPANSFEQTLISITQGCSVQSLVEIDSGEDFQISLMFFLLFPYHPPLDKDMALHLNKL